MNAGPPQQSEGASERWYGARFESPDSACSGGVIDCDLAVQQYGDGPFGNNPTPVGRFEDDAGILFKVDTTDLDGLLLEFDWRTFSASSRDELVVGYFVGDIPDSFFGADLTADLRGTPYAWSQWVQLDRQSSHSDFTHETHSIPGQVGPVAIGFWLDNGEGDYGKIDNVLLTATTVIPEPSTFACLALGLAGLGWRRMRQVVRRTSNG